MSEDFLSFLVNETLKLQQSGEVELSSLELKLNDYQLSFLKGEFIPLSQVLRFSTPFGVLDIPVNWSVFSLDEVSSSDQLVTEEDDKDCLLKVLKTAWNPEFKKLLITHADGFCYIVGLKAGQDYYIHDLLNPQELLKAA